MKNVSKRKPVKIKNLLETPEIDEELVEKAAKEIQESRQENPTPKKEAEKKREEKVTHEKSNPDSSTSVKDLKIEEKRIRVSVPTPPTIYIRAKAIAIEENLPALGHFFLHCVEAYLKGKEAEEIAL